MLPKRIKKNAARLYCEIEVSLAERLQAYSDETGVPKTVVVEKALAMYLDAAGPGPGVIPGIKKRSEDA